MEEGEYEACLMPTEAIIIDLEHIEPGDKIKIKNRTIEEVFVKQKFHAGMLKNPNISNATIEPIINNFRNRVENPESSAQLTVNSIAGGLSLPPLPS